MTLVREWPLYLALLLQIDHEFAQVPSSHALSCHPDHLAYSQDPTMFTLNPQAHFQGCVIFLPVFPARMDLHACTSESQCVPAVRETGVFRELQCSAVLGPELTLFLLNNATLPDLLHNFQRFIVPNFYF